MAEKKQAPLNTLLTIYFYHTRLTRESYEEWKEYKFPGHILYGLPLLENYGIHSVMHKCKYFSSRLKLMFYATKEILFCKEKYDVLYATSFRGIEPVIFLRALGLYRKPIVIWHHTAVVTNPKPWREQISRLFYKGIDHLLAEMPDRKPEGFISTGKENRDVDTLLQSFSATNEELDLYIAVSCGNINYKKILDRYSVPDSIHIHYTDGVIPYELGKLVARKSCIVICCLDFPYTVGLTTLVEAFALGIPVICSRNPNFEIDIDKEEIGITVEYNDVQGWIDAIRYIADHPEEARRMGENARKLAEERFNLEIFSREIAESLLEISNISSKNRTFA